MGPRQGRSSISGLKVIQAVVAASGSFYAVAPATALSSRFFSGSGRVVRVVLCRGSCHGLCWQWSLVAGVLVEVVEREG